MSATVITIYKNGDRHFPGKKVVVNRKVIRNFGTFLDRVTRDTCSRIAVRKIYTPTHGTYVRPKLDNLVHGATYVAAGTEPFRPTYYGYTGILPQLRTSQLKVKPQLRKVVSSRYRKEATAAPLKNRIIFVSCNGRTDDKPTKLLLDKGILESMDSILQHISIKLKLTTGQVGSLYSTEGTKIKRARQLVTNTNYVAVGNGKSFIHSDYLHEELVIAASKNHFVHKKYRGKFVGLTKQRRIQQDNLSYMNPYGKEFVTNVNEFRPKKDITFCKHELVNEEFDNANSGLQPRKWEVSTTYLLENEDQIPLTEESEINPEETSVEQLSQPVIRNITPVLSVENDVPPVERTEEEENDENSVFRATGNQKEIGEEINDDAKTRIEKTIDMLPAATVVEELDTKNEE